MSGVHLLLALVGLGLLAVGVGVGVRRLRWGYLLAGVGIYAVSLTIGRRYGRRRRRARWDRSERGSAAELALVTVPLMLILFVIVAMGRVASARGEVDAAARDAARAASLARDPAGASAAAQDAAAASLATDGIACRSFVVNVDLANFAPGGNVAAQVDCTISLSELTLLRLPASATLTSRFSEPVDTYLGVS